MFKPLLAVLALSLSVSSGYAQTPVPPSGFRDIPSREQMQLYHELAEKGDAEAQRYLGVIYEHGIGVPHNYETALALYRRAAASGHREGQMGLGRMYALGRGVEQDYTAAAKWFLLAAEQGLPLAMVELGSSYFEGLGVAVDYDKAHQWWLKAAALGNPTAMGQLGAQFELGQGVVVDIDSAIAWYKRGIEAGSTQSALNLGRLYVRGDSGIPGDVARGFALIRHAAEGGSSEAAYLLFGAFASGDKVKQDAVEALTWLIVAAERDPEPAGKPYQAQRDRINALINPAQRKLAESRAEAILAPMRLKK